MKDRLKLIYLTANKNLTMDISNKIGAEIIPTDVTRFADGEISFVGEKSVRGNDVFIIQSTCAPVTERLMELLICIDACKRAGANSISCVIPYFGYCRQDRMAKPRQAITAKLVASMIENAGATRIIAMDLHATQIAGFFDIPVDNISPAPLFYKYFKKLHLDDLVFVSPDHGGLVRTGKLAEKFNAPLAIIDKRRPEPNKTELLSIIGDVKGKNCIIVDDIVDTGGTLLQAINKLYELGAKSVYAAITHGVLSSNAVDTICNSKITRLVITDSIPLAEEKKHSKIDVISLSPLFSQVLLAIEHGESVAEAINKLG